MLPTKLNELITSVVNERPSPAHINEFVVLCRKIAIVQLRRKISVGKLDAAFFRMSIDDLALDCVADLLQQDDDGSLPQIAAFFHSLTFQSLEEAELLAHLRRLVYGKVNQSLFRLYNELDPALGKVLRNMKLAFQSVQTLQIIDRLGEQLLVPTLSDPRDQLPPIDPETLELTIREFFHESRKMPQLISKLVSFLREQTQYCRFVPLMTIAVVLRSIYSGDNEIPTEVLGIEEQLYTEDTSKIIKDVCRRVMKENQKTYVGKKLVAPEIYVKYFDVIQLNQFQKIIGQDGELFSYYESLRALIPDLTPDEYTKLHRAKLEYLSHIAYEAVRVQLKKHMS